MPHPLLTFAAPLALLLCVPAVADEVWVDAVHGDDTNGGLSAGDAWRTLTFALGQLGAPQAGTDLVHVLPGTYDQALGEVFPLQLRPRLEIRGEGPPDVVRIVGSGTVLALDLPAAAPVGELLLTSLAVRGGTTGLELRSTQGAVLLATLDLVTIDECATGLDVELDGSVQHSLVLSRTDIARCSGHAARVEAGGASLTFQVGESSFRESRRGLGLSRSGDGIVALVAERVVFAGNLLEGLRVRRGSSPGGALLANLVYLAITDNGVGADLESTGVLYYATIAGNGVGLRWMAPTPTNHVDVSVIHGNTIDVQGSPSSFFIASSLLAPGPFCGVNGNRCADPLFRDAAAGDYRPAFGSPAVDFLPGSGSGPLVDLTGFPRGNDGDLDIAPGVDVGGWELRTLTGPYEAALGGVAQFELLGPPGLFAALFVDVGGVLPTPTPTPFGARSLGPTATVTQLVRLAPQGPTQVPFQVPTDPSLVGTELGFQFLGRSPASPTGGAWSDAVAVRIVP